MLAMALCERPDLAGIERACGRLLESGAADLRVADAAGHQRSHYSGLLLYTWRRTLAIVESFLTPDQASRWAKGIEHWNHGDGRLSIRRACVVGTRVGRAQKSHHFSKALRNGSSGAARC